MPSPAGIAHDSPSTSSSDVADLDAILEGLQRTNRELEEAVSVATEELTNTTAAVQAEEALLEKNQQVYAEVYAQKEDVIKNKDQLIKDLKLACYSLRNESIYYQKENENIAHRLTSQSVYVTKQSFGMFEDGTTPARASEPFEALISELQKTPEVCAMLPSIKNQLIKAAIDDTKPTLKEKGMVDSGIEIDSILQMTYEAVKLPLGRMWPGISAALLKLCEEEEEKQRGAQIAAAFVQNPAQLVAAPIQNQNQSVVAPVQEHGQFSISRVLQQAPVQMQNQTMPAPGHNQGLSAVPVKRLYQQMSAPDQVQDQDRHRPSIDRNPSPKRRKSLDVPALPLMQKALNSNDYMRSCFQGQPMMHPPGYDPLQALHRIQQPDMVYPHAQQHWVQGMPYYPPSYHPQPNFHGAPPHANFQGFPVSQQGCFPSPASGPQGYINVEVFGAQDGNVSFHAQQGNFANPSGPLPQMHHQFGDFLQK